MAHTCKNCGAVADDPGHLCNPSDAALHCDYCGKHDVSAAHVCRQKLAAMKFSCTTCGRIADDGKHLCKPEEIH